MVVAVLYSAATDRLTPQVTAVRRGLLARLSRAFYTRRGARSTEYMRELSRQTLGESCVTVEANEPAFNERLRTASEVVLLWPDAIGSGWWPVERTIFRAKYPDARVFALNGRRRRYELNARTLAGFRVRRVLERLWLGEIAMTAIVMVALPFLVVWDLARGHK